MPKISESSESTLGLKKKSITEKTLKVKGEKTAKPASIAKNAGKFVHFRIFSPSSNIVEIGGDFNDWTPSKTPLARGNDGYWEGNIKVQPGRYEYKVVFDGSSWELDPTRESSEGNFGSNSVVIVE